jgi:hypothetical protein
MKMEQTVTLTLTEDECREYCQQLAEAESIIRADPLDHGNTRTGLTVLRDLRDLFEQRGLGIRKYPEYPASPPLVPPVLPQYGYPLSPPWGPYGPPPLGYPPPQPPYPVPPSAPSPPDAAAWMRSPGGDGD